MTSSAGRLACAKLALMVEIRGEGTMTVGTPSISMRSYLSTQHLWMAHHCAQYAQYYEDRYRGQRPAFHIHLRGYIIATVTESDAFVEALINELFSDVFDNHNDERLKVFDAASHQRMTQHWRDSGFGKTTSILEKYEFALSLNAQAGFDKGAEPYQSMSLLISLRNWQVHYYPSNVSDADPHSLQAKLKSRFEPNSLMTGSGNAWFPDKALGAGCSAWAVSTAEAFANNFVERFSYEPNYRSIQHPTDPPPLSGE